MTTLTKHSEQVSLTPHWTAGPILSSQQKKGFNRAGTEMKMRGMKTYFFEVYPPPTLAHFMQQPPPDVISHLQQEGVDLQLLNRRQVSFLAQVSLPDDAEASSVEISFISEQPQNGGIYKHESYLPRHMLCVRSSPVDTVLDSLNHALTRYNWYPAY